MKNRTEQNKKLFLETVKLTRGNISHTCRALSAKKGFNRGTIYHWLNSDAVFHRQLNDILTSLGHEATQAKANPIKKLSNGYIYMIKCIGQDIVKIGRSINPHSRLQSIKVACPFDVELIFTAQCSNYREVEQYLHKKLSDKHMKGEWFKVSDKDLKDIIKEVESIAKAPTREQRSLECA